MRGVVSSVADWADRFGVSYHCSVCKEHRSHKKNISIWKLPPVATHHPLEEVLLLWTHPQTRHKLKEMVDFPLHEVRGRG